MFCKLFISSILIGGLFFTFAYEISEEYDTPMFMRLSTRVSHSQSLVEVGEREEKELNNIEKNPGKYVMMPAMAKKRHVVVEERTEKLIALANEHGGKDNITVNIVEVDL